MRLFFEVISRLGRRVHISEERWKMIVTAKHVAITGRQREVELALVDSERIRRSRSDPAVDLYYRRTEKYWLCVVVKNENGTGFIITAYPTGKIKEGASLWPK